MLIALGAVGAWVLLILGVWAFIHGACKPLPPIRPLEDEENEL